VSNTQGKSEGLKNVLKNNDNIALKEKSAHEGTPSEGKNIHADIAKQIN
jgi:hypothetical protein